MSGHIVLPSTMNRASFKYFEEHGKFRESVTGMCQALTAGNKHFIHVTFGLDDASKEKQAEFVNILVGQGWKVIGYKHGKSASLYRKRLPSCD